jgi:hypothetical protein
LCLIKKQASGRIPDSGGSKKLAGFFIKNLVKLVKLVPDLDETFDAVAGQTLTAAAGGFAAEVNMTCVSVSSRTPKSMDLGVLGQLLPSKRL